MVAAKGRAISAPQNAAKVEVAFKDELAKMFKNGFTADELKIAKSGWLQQQQLKRAGNQSLASRLVDYLFINRHFDWDAKLEANVNELTPEQINSAMRKHLDPARISDRRWNFACALNPLELERHILFRG